MGKEKKEEQMRGANRLNNQTCGAWQAASKMAVLPFINRISDVGYAKAGAPSPIPLQKIAIFLNPLWMCLTCCP